MLQIPPHCPLVPYTTLFRSKERSLPGELSRGMKQKLSIACGFLHEPRLILLDEPLTGLDPIGIRRMKASLRQRAEQGAALRSEEHTSELQSQSNIVCRLLLE